jgi:hypothetical protein
MKHIKKRYVGIIMLFILGIFLYSPDIPLNELKKTYTNQFSKFIEIEEMNVHYRDEGEGEVILLIHGTGASLHTWDKWTNELKKKI